MKKRKIKSEDALGSIIGLLFTAFFLGMYHVVVYAFNLLRSIIYWTWRILLLIVVAIIEYFEKKSMEKKVTSVNNDLNIPEYSKSADSLVELYNNYYPELLNSIKSINGFDRKVSYPLLINPFENYYKSKKKIMFIGKETRYWILDEQNRFLKDTPHSVQVVQQLLLNYKEFNYGEKYTKSPFWQFCHSLYKEITLANDNDGFVWNNLSKVDENGTTPKWDVTKASTAFYPIIQNEIKILKPDVVIFLTGNSLDPYLKYLFKDLKFITTNNLFSKVVHPDLPIHTYRTSHPKKHRLSRTFDKVIKDIAFEVIKEKASLTPSPSIV